MTSAWSVSASADGPETSDGTSSSSSSKTTKDKVLCPPGLCITPQDLEQWEACQAENQAWARQFDELERDVANCQGRLEERAEGELVCRKVARAQELELQTCASNNALCRDRLERTQSSRWYWAGGGVVVGVAVTVAGLLIFNKVTRGE